MLQIGIWATLLCYEVFYVPLLNKKRTSTTALHCLVPVEFFVTAFPPALLSQVWLKLKIFAK